MNSLRSLHWYGTDLNNVYSVEIQLCRCLALFNLVNIY